MKNRILIFSLIIWVFCGVLTSSYFSTNADSPENKTVTNSLNNLQFSSTSSYDSLNVYGSGTLTEDSPSGLSYRITVTVTSPSGRTNTTQSDWSPAPITNTTGLSIGDEDGTYTIQATFESQNGSYDEYDDFEGTGNINYVGTLTNVADVPPQITLTNLIFTSPTIPAIAGRTSNAVATVAFSRNVPPNTTVDMEINDAPIGVGNPLYNINGPTFDPTSGGMVFPNSGNREVRLTVPAAAPNPRSIRVTFPFVLSSNTGSGTVSANVRMGNVMPQTSPTIQISPPLGLTTTLTVSPTPGGNSGGGNNECWLYCNSGGNNGFGNPQQPTYDPNSPCCQTSPILIDVLGDGFAMTDAANGVDFDFNGDGIAHKLSWTAANSDDAWLVLDRNNNHLIDSSMEMFGNFTQQPDSTERNGFLALAEFDKPENGGNGDGKITRRDAVFRKLRLWQDRNHNGISEAEEMSRLPALDVVAVRLDYQTSKRTDAYGNRFKYRAKVRDRRDANVGRWAWDVFLTVEQ